MEMAKIIDVGIAKGISTAIVQRGLILCGHGYAGFVVWRDRRKMAAVAAAGY